MSLYIAIDGTVHMSAQECRQYNLLITKDMS
jgi:hypothetical protein